MHRCTYNGIIGISSSSSATFAHLRIKGLRVEGIEVQTGLLISVRVEGEGNDRDMLLLQIRSREIGRGIGYDSEHDIASFCM